MKKFQFTLGKLLAYKERMLEKEKNSLAALRGERNRLEEKLAELERTFERIDCEFKSRAQKGTTIGEIQGFQYQLDNIRIQRKLLLLDIEQLEADIDNQLNVVVALSREVSELESLKEHQLEEYNKQVAKAEETLISEFVISQIARNKMH